MFHHYQSQLKKAEEIVNRVLKENSNLQKKSNFLRNKLEKSENEKKRIVRKHQNAYYEIDQDRDTYLCQLCITSPRNTILLPCRHFFCSKCIGQLDQEICPNCREIIEGVLDPIY